MLRLAATRAEAVVWLEPPSDERSWLTRMVFAEWNPSPSYVAPGELGWVATVDARSGAAVSERRRVLA